MADPVIESLLEGPDNFELVRDRIASILALESEGQQTLAAAANKNPLDWKLRVFLERSNPWSEWVENPDKIDAAPIINVSWQDFAPDTGSGSTVSGGKTVGTYHVDCYGYGKSADVEAGGHTPGDEAAGLEIARIVRLVRRILMSGHYAYLGFERGFIARRILRSVTSMDIPLSERGAQHVVAARLVFGVEFLETSPQVQGVILESIYLEAKRAKDQRLYFAAQYGEDS